MRTRHTAGNYRFHSLELDVHADILRWAHMIVIYRDDLGYLSVDIDEHGINFDQSFDGGIIAKFSDGTNDYEVFAFNLVSIQNR